MRARTGRAGIGFALLLMTSVMSFVAPALAARVVRADLHSEGGWLVVDLEMAELLDPKTRSTIESGLPGSCILELQLVDARGDAVVTRVVERSLELDLWENVVRLVEGERRVTLPTLEEADAAWSRLRARRLVRLDDLRREESYRLRVAIVVQPLGAEERQRVSRWVREGSRSGRRSYAFDIGGLVRRFMGAGGDEEITRWTSPPFTRGDVVARHEGSR